MKKFNTLLKILFVSLTFVFVSCEIDSFAEEDQFSFGDINAPTNVQISASIAGTSSDNPNGDGSGKVSFSGSADNAITYKFVYNGEETVSPDGKITYTFAKLGLNTYTVTIIAVGKGGTTSSKAINVDVLVTYTPPAALVKLLTTGTWRIAAEEGAHMGVGPNEAPDPWWWSANPYDKASSGLYDDRYTFNADGTFTFDAGPDSELFGKVIPLERDFGGDRGQVSQANNEHENYPVTQEDVDKISGTWYITAPGGVETLNFTGLGHVGFYIGSHSLEILDRSNPNEIRLKNYFADENNAWWWKITNKD